MCATLQRAYNLTFFKYKLLLYYSLSLINAVTIKQLYNTYLQSLLEQL